MYVQFICSEAEIFGKFCRDFKSRFNGARDALHKISRTFATKERPISMRLILNEIQGALTFTTRLALLHSQSWDNLSSDRLTWTPFHCFTQKAQIGEFGVVKASESHTKGQNSRRLKSRTEQLVAVRNSSPGRPEPCEGNLLVAAGSWGGLMVKYPWPLLEISLSDLAG